MATLFAGGLAAAMWRWTEQTRGGKALRAVSQNQTAAQLMGINVNYVAMTTFMLAGLLAVSASFLVIPIYGVSPSVGLMMVIKGFAIIVTGGLGNIPGAILIGYSVGIAEALLSGLVYGPLKDIFAYVFIIVLLWIRPQGLMGRKVTGI
jgi:branched-chain amino acid transport system permease protein